MLSRLGFKVWVSWQSSVFIQYSNLYDLGMIGNWNWAESIASGEIVATLNAHGISIPTAP